MKRAWAWLLSRAQPRIRELEFSNEMWESIVQEIRESLETVGCEHGKDLASTPPMWYPETILCAVRHGMRTEREACATLAEANVGSEIAPLIRARGQQ